MSQLKVNSIIPVGGVATGQGGGIIQVVQTVKSDAFSHTDLAKNTQTATVLSRSITPSSNSNKSFHPTNLSYICR